MPGTHKWSRFTDLQGGGLSPCLQSNVMSSVDCAIVYYIFAGRHNKWRDYLMRQNLHHLVKLGSTADLQEAEIQLKEKRQNVMKNYILF